jgi:hypothetical protein
MLMGILRHLPPFESPFDSNLQTYHVNFGTRAREILIRILPPSGVIPGRTSGIFGHRTDDQVNLPFRGLCPGCTSTMEERRIKCDRGTVLESYVCQDLQFALR